MGEKPTSLTLARFHSVMRLVLSTLEPLPMNSLDALHCTLRGQHDHYKVTTILEPMGPLLSGVSSSSALIRPLHSSFHEYLTTHERSGIFFIDMKNVDLDLACACLSVMQQDLHFNMCKLESSYVWNSEVADLEEKVKTFITSHLSYSCQSWANHMQAIPFQPSLAGQIGTLLQEKMLFWIEVLSLLKMVNMVPSMLAAAVNWLQVC